MTTWRPTAALSRSLAWGTLGVAVAVVLGRPVVVVLCAPVLLLGALGLLHRPASRPLVETEVDHVVLHEGQGTRVRLVVDDTSGVEQPAEQAGRGVQGNVPGGSGQPGDLLDRGGVIDDQPHPGALPLVEDDVVHLGVDQGPRGRPVQQRQGREQHHGSTQHQHHGSTQDDRGHEAEGAPGHRAVQRRRGSPGRHRCSTRSSVLGVATVRSTSSTTRRPLTSVIHSSGRTVIRCASTGRATALTSSGMT